MDKEKKKEYNRRYYLKNKEKLSLSVKTWANHGKWHIDHIMPVSSFDKNTTPDIVNSLTNLQPLWANDNLKKSNNIL